MLQAAAHADERTNVLQYPVLNIMKFRNVNNWYHHRLHRSGKNVQCEGALTETTIQQERAEAADGIALKLRMYKESDRKRI